MSSDRFDDQSHLPVWLRNVPLPPHPDAPSPSSEVRSGSGGSDADLPPWLREDDSSQTDDSQTLPSWLSSEPSASPAAHIEPPAPRLRNQGFTGWLSSIDAPASASDSESTSQEQLALPDDSDASSDEMPDWLRQLSSEVAPDDRADVSAPASSETDWLDSSREVAPGDAPGWLTEDMGQPSGTDAAPDWLSADTDAPEQIEQAHSAWTSGTPDDTGPALNLPSWLSDASDTTGPADQTAPSWLSDTPNTTGPADQTAPSWLSNDIDDSSATTTPSWLSDTPDTTDPANQTAPSWLSDTPDTTSPADETAPSWLNDTSSSTSVDTDTPSWLSDTPGSASADADTPSWLSDQHSISTPPVDDHLQEGIAQSLDDLHFQPFSFEDDNDSSSSTTGGAPAWLSADSNTTHEDDTLSVPAWLASDEPASPTSDALETPAWLHSDEPASPASHVSETPTWTRSDEAVAAQQDLPSWLQEDMPGAQSPGAETLPDWLDQEPGPAQAALPDWLSSEHPPATDSVTPHPAGIPDWLTDTAAPDADAQAADENVPDWLRDTQIASTPAFTPTDLPESFVEASEDQPAWLTESLSSAETHLELPNDWNASEAQPVEELPDWLHTDEQAAPPAEPQLRPEQDALPPWLKDEHGEPLPSAMAPGDTNLPAWLRGMQDQHGIRPETAAQPPAEEQAPSLAEEQGMSFDWFDDEPATPATPAPQTNADLLGGAELPAWLRSDTEKPREKEKEAVEGRSLDWLSKLGGGDEDEQLTADAPPRLSPIPLPSRTAGQVEAIALMRKLARQPYPSKPLIVSEERQGFQQLGVERLLSILLLLALIVAIAVPGLSTPFQTTGNSAVASPLLEQIQTLGENDIVLLGYEWDAQRVSEMRPLERAVIGQLLEQKVKLILVSTDPQASLLQYDLREQMTLQNYQGGGLDYILLGYRPGGEIALRSMAQDFRSVLRSDFQGRDATLGPLATKLEDSTPRVSTLRDLSMVIVLADEPADVQGWMEQIYPGLKKPMAFLIPAGLQPVAQPYFQQPDVYAVTGTRGALAYEQMRGGNVATETARAAGQVNLATVIFAVILLLSALGVFIGQIVRQRSPA